MSTKSTHEVTFDRWLSDGESWIGVYENAALDSFNAGRRVALVFGLNEWDNAKLKSRAPDINIEPINGVGWRWILVAKCKTTQEAMEAMEGEDRAI